MHGSSLLFRADFIKSCWFGRIKKPSHLSFRCKRISYQMFIVLISWYVGTSYLFLGGLRLRSCLLLSGRLLGSRLLSGLLLGSCLLLGSRLLLCGGLLLGSLLNDVYKNVEW